jgi:hypothetical protein
MVKLKDKRKLLWCLKQFHEGKISQKWLSSYLGVSSRRFRQLYTTYKQTLQTPNVGLNVGRPQKTIPEQWKQTVKETYNKYHLNALTLEKVMQHERKIRIPHNTIHRIMIENGYCIFAAKQTEKTQTLGTL